MYYNKFKSSRYKTCSKAWVDFRVPDKVGFLKIILRYFFYFSKKHMFDPSVEQLSPNYPCYSFLSGSLDSLYTA